MSDKIIQLLEKEKERMIIDGVWISVFVKKPKDIFIEGFKHAVQIVKKLDK